MLSDTCEVLLTYPLVTNPSENINLNDIGGMGWALLA